MSLIEPHRFTPHENGRITSVTLPGLHRDTHVDVLRIGRGLVLAHSHFSPAQRHEDEIRRPEDQLILAFNLSGRMVLTDPGGARHEIGGGEGWIIRSGGRRLHRVVEKDVGCSNLVISQSVNMLAPELLHLLDLTLPPAAPFRRLRLPVPGGSALEHLLDGRTTPAAILRKEGQCLALIGHAIEELSACPRPGCVTGDTELLVQRLTALLAERLAETISMADIEREAGLSHVTLNQIFRKATGMTVFERLRALRLEAAERMVRLTDRSLTEIAGDCGFSDASHLSNAFRKRFGSTASAWRKNMRQKL